MILDQLMKEVKTQQLTKESANVILNILSELKKKDITEVF